MKQSLLFICCLTSRFFPALLVGLYYTMRRFESGLQDGETGLNPVCKMGNVGAGV